MGITRIGSLIINENGFNLLLIVLKNQMTFQLADEVQTTRWGCLPGGVDLATGPAERAKV